MLVDRAAGRRPSRSRTRRPCGRTRAGFGPGSGGTSRRCRCRAPGACRTPSSPCPCDSSTRGTRCFTSILQVQDEVGDDGEAEELARPLRVGAHHRVPRERRVHVAVGDHDEAGAQRRDDLVLEPVGEVGGVEQAERRHVELVAGLRLVDGLGEQRRARPAGVDDRRSPAPRASGVSCSICVERPTPSVPSMTIRLPAQRADLQIRQPVAVERPYPRRARGALPSRPEHLDAAQLRAPAAAAGVMSAVASMTSRPNSRTSSS